MRTRSDSATARRTADQFAIAQVAKMHRRRVADTAATLKARSRAARLAGLESVTVHLPIGDARLLADVLTEWGRERDADAVTERKESTT